MKRLAALVVAIGLIVVALVIRNNRDAEEARGPYRLTCATEFAETCRTLAAAEVAVTVEPAGVTADRLIAGNKPEFEGWLAAGPWADVAGDGIDSTTVLAHTQVAMVIWKDRAAALRRACGPLTAKCLGDAAGRGTWAANRGEAAWGPVKVAFADPATEGAGLAVLTAGTSAVIGSLDIVPAALEANDSYINWLNAVAKARVAGDLGRILATGPSVADAYIGIDAEVSPAVAQAARRGEVEVVYLAPVDIEAKLARSSGGRQAPDGLGAALRANGWRATQQPAAAKTPNAGGWAGLRGLWKDTVR